MIYAVKPKHINDIIIPITVSLLPKKKKSSNYYLFVMLDNWKWIVGDDIYQKSFPYKVSFQKGSNILYIFVERYVGVEVLYMKEQIINNINSYFGKRLVDNIRLIECSL